MWTRTLSDDAFAPMKRTHRVKEIDQVQKLKLENEKLRRKIARLRKGAEQVVSDEEDAEPMAVRPQCPHCKADDVRRFVTPNGIVVRTCGACKKRLTNAS